MGGTRGWLQHYSLHHYIGGPTYARATITNRERLCLSLVRLLPCGPPAGEPGKRTVVDGRRGEELSGVAELARGVSGRHPRLSARAAPDRSGPGCPQTFRPPSCLGVLRLPGDGHGDRSDWPLPSP